MKFDEIVAQLGEFGTYQKRVFFMLSPAAMACGIQIMISVFNMGVPHHRCALPDYPNDTWAIQSPEHAQWINASIPRDPEIKDKRGYSRCKVYFHDNVTMEKQTVTCTQFVYNTSPYRTSAVTKWNLVCERKIYRSHSRMIMMGGLLVGAFATGIIADIIGRKLALMLMVFLQATSSIGVAWAPSFVVYVILRFITGITISGQYLVVFVLVLELVGPTKRMFVGVVITGFWSIGVMIVGGVAYAVRDWDTLQMLMSFPILLLLFYWWMIPESPRWLLARGRDAEAEDIIRKVARVNKVTLPEKVLKHTTPDDVDRQDKIWHIFTSPVLALHVLILCCNWLVASMVFYGLSLNSGNLGGSVYVNFQLMAVVEIIAYIVCLLLLNRIGRRMLHIICMTIGGSACISTIFAVLYTSPETQTWLIVVLSLLGKLGASAAFSIVYIYSAELFPTIIRNSLMGIVCLFARVGGMISPYIADLDDLVGGKFGTALPLFVFGASTIGAGLLCIFLPETLHKHLPETLEDAKVFGRKKPNNRLRQRDVKMDFTLDMVANGNDNCENGGRGQEKESLTSDSKQTTGEVSVIYKPGAGASGNGRLKLNNK